MATTYKMNKKKQLLITTKLMKKTMLFAAIAALVLVTGCAKNIDLAPTATTQHAIGFSHYTPRSLSKANDTFVNGTTLVAGKTFAVYAWATTYSNFLTADPGAPGFMNPAVVTWNDNDAEGAHNAYTPLRYWPAGTTPDNLSFTAYYPYSGAGITAPTFTSGVGTYAFEAQSTSAAMVDFCVADVVNDQVYGNTNATSGSSNKGTVAFTFKHQLAKVQFKFKTDNNDSNTEVKLKGAKLYNIQTKGTLTATYEQNATPAVNAACTTTTTWSAQAIASTPVVYDVTFNGTAATDAAPITLHTNLIPADASSSNPATDIFLMVPQTMIAPAFSATPNTPEKLTSNAQYLLVSWDVTTGGVTTSNTQALYLDQCVTEDNGSSQANIDWAKNSFVTYTITIGPKPIYFTATVTDWATEQTGFFNVN